jgi:hypothetical protein
MLDEATIRALKPGDRVGVRGGWDDGCEIYTVTRVTPAGQVVLDNGDRFTPGGKRIGDQRTWHPYRLVSAARSESLVRRTALYKSLRELRDRADGLCKSHGAASAIGNTTPITPEERAELLAIIARCAGE